MQREAVPLGIKTSVKQQLGKVVYLGKKPLSTGPAPPVTWWFALLIS